jgi:hypothetical protein
MDRIQASEDLLRALVGEASMLSRSDRTRLVKLLGMLRPASATPRRRPSSGCAKSAG